MKGVLYTINQAWVTLVKRCIWATKLEEYKTYKSNRTFFQV